MSIYDIGCQCRCPETKKECDEKLSKCNRSETRKGGGYFGIGIYGPKMTKNIGTLWRTADIFGADFMFTIGMQCLQPQRNTHRICTNKLFV